MRRAIAVLLASVSCTTSVVPPSSRLPVPSGVQPAVFVASEKPEGHQAPKDPKAKASPDESSTTLGFATASESKARPDLKAWIAARIPPEGVVTQGEDGRLQVQHTVKAGQTLAGIAKIYHAISTVYFEEDFVKELVRKNQGALAKFGPGTKITVSSVVTEPFKSPDEERLGWPEDRQARGIYLRDDTRGRIFNALEKMPARGMNAIVLDGKDYEGYFTYPSAIPLVRETGAAKGAPIRDLARLVRFAHARGVRIIMRICCFHDPYTQKHAPQLSIKGRWGGPYPIGWLDPSDSAAQQYVLDAVHEVLDAGVDEVNLDYIRYPVQPHLGNAKLEPAGPARIQVIRDFVRRVHEVTKPRGATLSLDVFGVAAFGNHPDIDNLGQDITLLAKECEAIAPMVYPSHFDKGYRGWSEPGDHPEIIGIGTKAAVELLEKAKVRDGAVIRPWLQAFRWKSPNYGPKYLADEVRHANHSGGSGWLLWNPAQDYELAYGALGVPVAAR